jgi:predicted metal-dependent hydrolase
VTDTTTPQPPATAVQTSTPGWAVPTRRISFAPRLGDLPKHFARDENIIFSHLAAAFSTILPDGETFFVDSVRHYRDRITDPDLKRQVAGFIGQESVHAREHRELDDRLAQLGYPTNKYEWLMKKGMWVMTRVRKAEANLAHTAAAEHLTATLAELVMGDPEVRALFGQEIGDILLWHCLEESEHKAVSFDVYRAVGGSEKQRVRSAKDVRWSSAFLMGVFVGVSLLFDRATYRRGNLRRSWRQVKASPFASREFLDQVLAYDKPDFHPNDRDTRALVAQWRAELFGEDGRMNELLAGATR